MLQVSHQLAANVVAFRPRPAAPTTEVLSPTAMAGYLRQTHPMNARCFALEMQDQAAWANESWGEYWGDVARLL